MQNTKSLGGFKNFICVLDFKSVKKTQLPYTTNCPCVYEQPIKQ